MICFLFVYQLEMNTRYYEDYAAVMVVYSVSNSDSLKVGLSLHLLIVYLLLYSSSSIHCIPPTVFFIPCTYSLYTCYCILHTLYLPIVYPFTSSTHTLHNILHDLPSIYTVTTHLTPRKQACQRWYEAVRKTFSGQGSPPIGVLVGNKKDFRDGSADSRWVFDTFIAAL